MNAHLCREELRFALVIPALNESMSIGATLEKAMTSRSEIVKETGIREMCVIFVNDGSTDNTQSIADQFLNVIKINFKKNQGYGAAIKAGFHATKAELVGFMDADGTCEPIFFIKLINALLETNSDIVVGSRMTKQSEMPLIRRIGNLLFAKLIGKVSGKEVTDSASGMRVIKRTSLPMLHPLPDGLHFTPAMTSLALLDNRLSIIEVPMPYKERVGKSKLRIVKDGLKFLFIILFSAALFNPIASLTIIGGFFLILGVIICITANAFGVEKIYLSIYAAGFLIVFMQAIFVGVVCHQMINMLLGIWPSVTGFCATILHKYFWTKRLVKSGIIIFGLALLCFESILLLPKFWQLPMSLLGSFLIIIAGWTSLAGVILRVVWAAKERRQAEIEALTLKQQK